jgi:hypothetical protein
MLRLILGLGVVAGSLLATRAHDFLTGFVQHRVELTVGLQHIDVTVQLTLFEDTSEHEREEIDSNRDGRLTREELSSYLKELEPKLAKGLGLEVDGRNLPLMALYPAEFDLLGDDRVSRGHHRLTLYYFAETPTNLTAGADITLKDWLWADTGKIGLLQTVGKDGCQLEAKGSRGGMGGQAKATEPLVFKLHVVNPPVVSARPAQASKAQRKAVGRRYSMAR